MSRQRQHWLILLVLILSGFALRLFQLNQASLRGDEAFTVLHWMREPLSQTLSSIVTIDPQPPLAYAIYYIYGQIVGSQEFVVRFLPAFLNLIGIPALYAIGKRLGSRQIGYIAALLFAISPAILWHAQDARNYPIWAAAAAVSLWLGLVALKRQRLIDWVLFIAASAVACYLYYLQLFFVAVLNLYVIFIYWHNRKLLVQWFASQLVLALVLAPWFLQPQLLSGGGYGGTAGQLEISEYITAFIPTLIYGSSLSRDISGLAIVCALALMGVGVYVLWGKNRKAVLLCLLMGIVPLILIGIVSLRLNVFVPRYVLAASIAYFVLIGAGIYAVWYSRNNVIRVAVAGISFIFVSALALSLFNYYFVNDYAKSPHWRELANYLNLRVSPEDSIINTSADPALTFYLNELGVPAEELYLPANPDQPMEEIEALIQERLDNDTTLWVVAQPQSGWENAHAPEGYLRENAQRLRQTSISGLRVEEFHQWQTGTLNGSLPINFGEIAELVGSQLDAPPYPDNQLVLQLVWRAVGQSEIPLKFFVHLRSSDSDSQAPAAQDDQFIQEGRTDTSAWAIGSLFRDAYSIPLEGVSPGEYALYVGIYDPVTGERLLVNDSASDSVLIGTVTIQ